jgi:hypothetical protein
VIQEHYGAAKKVVVEEEEEEERISSAAILVDVSISRSGVILSEEGWRGHYGGPEESRRWVGSAGWKKGRLGTDGRGSFPDG